MLANENAHEYVTRLAQQKASVAWQQLDTPAYPLLAADTTVEMQGQILGKPNNTDEARRMLEQLSAHTHLVHTAVVLVTTQGMKYALSSSQVTMMDIPTIELTDYVASGAPFGKAGGYGIQDWAGTWVSHLSGSFSGVMGLPLYETMMLFRQAGISLASNQLGHTP